MNIYDRMMSHITFREDFCEDTLKKSTKQHKTQKTSCRWIATAACFCLCTVLLLGTALAFSPTLRGILIPNHRAEETEVPVLPTDPNANSVNSLDGIVARYYKLDGTSAADAGFGSAYPVMKDGVLSFYSLTDEGELQKAESPKHIQTDITYKGKTWSLDMDVYGGDILTVHEGDLKYPLDGNHITLGRREGNLWLPIYVDLTTMEIEDPALKLSFTPDIDAGKTYVYGYPGSTTLLIVSELANESQRFYLGNGQTGQTTLLGEGDHDRWFLQNGKVYSYDGETMSLVREDGEELPLFDGNTCSYDENGFAYRWEGKNLHVIDLRDQGEYILENCSESFQNPVFTHNRAGTKLCISHFELQDGLYNTTIAIVDRESGTMVTLNRDPAMTEQIMGWFDHDHLLIGGTIEGEWYICLYEIS